MYKRQHRWREANRGVPDREGYVRLEWAAGSMQVDFGVARARIAGEMADVHCLVVSLPYSNMRLCVALPGENAECLCHGLMPVSYTHLDVYKRQLMVSRPEAFFIAVPLSVRSTRPRIR